MPPPLDPEKRAAIAEAIDGERSRASIAREFDVSPGTVKNIADELGIDEPFARTQTAAATRARQEDNRARRAALAAGFLDDCDLARQRLREPYLYVTGTKDGIETLEIPAPDAPAFRAFQAASKVAFDAHVAAEKVDATDGVDEARSALHEFMASVREAADHQRTEEVGVAQAEP